MNGDNFTQAINDDTIPGAERCEPCHAHRHPTPEAKEHADKSRHRRYEGRLA